jgi:hypothetical protein
LQPLLAAAAAAHDDHYKPKKSKRPLYFYNLIDDDVDEIEVQHSHDIEYLASSIQAHATKSHSEQPCESNVDKIVLSYDKWF